MRIIEKLGGDETHPFYDGRVYETDPATGALKASNPYTGQELTLENDIDLACRVATGEYSIAEGEKLIKAMLEHEPYRFYEPESNHELRLDPSIVAAIKTGKH